MSFRDQEAGWVIVSVEVLAKGYKMSLQDLLILCGEETQLRKRIHHHNTELGAYLEMPDLDLTSRVPHILRVSLKLSWRKEGASSFWLCATISSLFFSFLPFGPKVSLCHLC